MDIIIFGISGDLAERKLIPAILGLYTAGTIPHDSRIIGFSRSVKQFNLPFEYIHVAGSYSDAERFEYLKSILRPEKKKLFYCALPPQASEDVLHSLEGVDGVILIEKPFGTGLEDATKLVEYLKNTFTQGQYLKVDHYAGKKELREAVVENPLDISEIVCEMFETATVEHRKAFYNEVGELRDVGQNHLLFMLTTILKGEGKREDILESLVPGTDDTAYLFGRYEGNEGRETLFSVPALIQKPGYDHIKITLRAGKALDANKVAIRITYTSGKIKEIILSSSPQAYENILLDALEGKKESFLSDKEVLAAWRFIESIEKIEEKKELICYPIGHDQRIFNAEDAGTAA